jgi:hypothetical protein
VNVHVHIDRLVVHDVELSQRERQGLGPAIQRELAALYERTAEPAGITQRGALAATATGGGRPLAARIASDIHRRATATTVPPGRPR